MKDITSVLEKSLYLWICESLYLSSTVETLRMLIPLDQKTQAPFMASSLSLAEVFSFPLKWKIPKLWTGQLQVVRVMGRILSYEKLNVSIMQHSTCLHYGERARSWFFLDRMGCCSRPGTWGPICQSRWSWLLFSHQKLLIHQCAQITVGTLRSIYLMADGAKSALLHRRASS